MSSRLHPGFVALVASVAFASDELAHATAQQLVFEVSGQGDEDRLGASVVELPDVDGDSVPDLLIGATGGGGGGLDLAGRAFVYSGASGAQLLRLDGDAPRDYFGSKVADLGDVDGDGLRDFAIAAPQRVLAGGPRGAVFVWSGTGALLRTITTSYPSGIVGREMVALGDVDGDGVRDLLYNDFDGATTFAVIVASGATGATIRTHTSAGAFDGAILGAVGDVENDGVEDYAIVEFSNSRTVVRSGASGASLFTCASMPSTLRTAGDVDADGHVDLLFTVFNSGVSVFSGNNGALLFQLKRSGDATFGAKAAAIGDWDGDGYDDLVVSREINWFNWFDPRINLYVYSGATQMELAAWLVSDGIVIESIDATSDFDGDGVRDVVAGSSLAAVSGKVSLVSGANGSRLLQLAGVGFVSHLGSSATLVGDRDGDGWRDVAVAAPGGVDAAATSTVLTLSGRDGHEVARFATTQPMTERNGQLARTGDVDGDGIDDLAVACGGVRPCLVEIRSGADDSLLATIGGSFFGAFGWIAAAVDTAGEPLLAVSTFLNSSFLVYDLRTLLPTTQIHGVVNAEVGCVGDVDGDGSVDWLARDTILDACGVLSGNGTGAILWSRYGSPGYEVSTVATVGDLSGDGYDDVLVGSSEPGHDARVTALSGVDGSTLFEIVQGPQGSAFGRELAALGDVDRDGGADFALFEGGSFYKSSLLHVWSGAMAAPLFHFTGEPSPISGDAIIAVPRWHDATDVDGDAIPDLVAGFPAMDGGRGRVRLLRLDDLALQIDPPSALAGETVTVATRGGPASAPAGLYAVDFSGSPLSHFVAFGAFDALGAWTVAAIVPPGLSGNTLTLRSYAIGHGGKVVVSSDATLTLE